MTQQYGCRVIDEVYSVAIGRLPLQYDGTFAYRNSARRVIVGPGLRTCFVRVMPSQMVDCAAIPEERCMTLSLIVATCIWWSWCCRCSCDPPIRATNCTTPHTAFQTRVLLYWYFGMSPGPCAIPKLECVSNICAVNRRLIPWVCSPMCRIMAVGSPTSLAVCGAIG